MAASNDSTTIFGAAITLATALLGKIFATVKAPDLALAAQCITILVGLSTLFISWPKIKERMREVFNKIVKK